MNFSLLKRASYRFNVLVIEFNIGMIQENEHSYKNIYNYAFKIDDKLIIFSKDINVTELFPGDTISFTFPLEFSKYLTSNSIISIGYVTFNEIHYVQSRLGYIHPICDTVKLSNPIEELSILNGTAEVMDSKTLHYFYSGDNSFFNVSKDDFYLEIDNIEISPIALINYTKKELILEFPNNIFKNYSGQGYLKIRNITSTQDLYGFKLHGNESLTLGTYISSLSICNSTNNATFLKVVFSLPLSNLSIDDFAIQYNGIDKKFDLAFLSDDKTTMYIALYEPNALTENINLYTNVSYSEVKTLNYLGNKVYVPNKKIIIPFSIADSTWNVYSNSLASSILSITFNSPPDPKTIITNSSFINQSNPWNGQPLSIPKGSLQFIKGSDFDSITINNNPSFGTIKIYSLDNLNFITNTTSNTELCSLTLNENILSFSFNTNEKIQANPLSIKLFEYIPSENIKDTTGKSISVSPVVKGLLTYTSSDDQTTTYYPPLDNNNSNPFSGEPINNNVVVYVDASHDMRTYGSDDSSLITKITGNLTIISEDIGDDKISLQNIIVTDNLYINSNVSNFSQNNVDINGTVYIIDN